MKIVLINTIKPAEGSGDGITEYAYQLYRQLSKDHEVDLFYSLDGMIRYNIKGLVYTNTVFRKNLAKLFAGRKYDIVHIVNHEVGFVPNHKIIKQVSPNMKVITTLHDMARFEGINKTDLFQNAYDLVVRRNVSDALECSDFMIFNSSQTKNAVQKHFRLGKPCAVINMGVRESILKRPQKPKSKKPLTDIGYLGSFARHKNVLMLLKAAQLLKNEAYSSSCCMGAERSEQR